MDWKVKIAPNVWPEWEKHEIEELKFCYKGAMVIIGRKFLSWGVKEEPKESIYEETWEYRYSVENSQWYCCDSIQECFNDAISFINEICPDESSTLVLINDDKSEPKKETCENENYLNDNDDEIDTIPF